MFLIGYRKEPLEEGNYQAEQGYGKENSGLEIEQTDNYNQHNREEDNKNAAPGDVLYSSLQLPRCIWLRFLLLCCHTTIPHWTP